MDNSETIKFPMLEAILSIQAIPIQPMYTNRDVARIFGVCVRAIQNWISAGRLTPRTYLAAGGFSLKTSKTFSPIAGWQMRSEPVCPGANHRWRTAVSGRSLYQPMSPSDS